MNCAGTRKTWREEAARRSIDSRWKDVMLMVVAAACLIVPATASTLIAGRHKTDRECSLQTVEGDDIAPMEYCSFLPGLGENRHKRVLIQFGESNCKFTLRNCVPNYCYVIRDFSGLLPRDVDIDALENYRDLTGNFGVFKNATVQGAEHLLTSEGLFFAPQVSDVTITYTTKTCAAFYSKHGREWPQLCDGNMGLLSNAMLVFDRIEGLDCKAGI
eukprot:CAMPEP_0179473966 /NCGR_PEP_ID=MMETSP0799-20121207/53537_1 /TAXON_ID=46947 /ORGANISM="Geminigera cryophila, Strain CCMP2564" /LENGTH=215 /DNA_ID=CAMNT_0021282787 /DNA_START=38 /DNA_END=685 /DNA_ORIENTATION=+